ncbi:MULTISPECIES: hypothetical protein [unclassified Deinococcus]|uniref:hypothetical protein n=1 Tax=unclassified Deinococcus TaxID=2623546 RepID=UPI001C89C3CF|nr:MULTISPECIES: hypothetical protein [unclassified Deinococcus]MBX8463713.1 hypothetical protein [Deinococcus sp. RIT780]MCD0156966.1 hypothetical protein [Deinococcus sp. 6GRE01]
MKKTLMTVTAALALTFATGNALAASGMAYATDGNGLHYGALYTESSWMAIEVPLADLGGTLPGDLSITTAGLSRGTTITLDSTTRQGNMALLYVTVERSDTSSYVNDIASITVNAGGKALTTVSIPVYGAGYDQ